MQESSTDLRGFGLLPLAMKERHLLKADVSLSFRRPSAKGFSCGENACRTQKRKALKPDGFKAFCGMWLQKRYNPLYVHNFIFMRIYLERSTSPGIVAVLAV